MADQEPEDRQEGAPDPEASSAAAESPAEPEEEAEGSGGLSIVGALREALSGKTPLSADDGGAEPEGTDGEPPDRRRRTSEPQWPVSLIRDIRQQPPANRSHATVFAQDDRP